MIRLEKLNKDVAYFMDAFFKVAKDGFNFDLLNDFPIACCEFSSMLLARFLIEKQGYDATELLIVMGKCKKECRSTRQSRGLAVSYTSVRGCGSQCGNQLPVQADGPE